MGHNTATRRRISERMAQAHARLRQERGGYRTADGNLRANAKYAAYYTPERRRWHGQLQQSALQEAHHACVVAADRFARRFLALILEMQHTGMSLRSIAAAMNDRGYTTRRGCAWTDQTVRQLLKRKKNLLAAEVINQPHYIGWTRPGRRS